MIIPAIAALMLIGTITFLFISKFEKSIYFMLVIFVLVIRLFNIVILNYAVLNKDLNLLMIVGDIRIYVDILLYITILIIGVMYMISINKKDNRKVDGRRK